MEEKQAGWQHALQWAYPRSGKAHIIGVTGPPGSGKSTLINALALELRRRSKTVGIIAVDPSSAISGGSLLGDRIRMRDVATDPGVFVRSVAARGWLGGLAAGTYAIAVVLDAVGREVLLVETVGAGQGELEVAHLADTTLVVQSPGQGDSIQALKAGLLEMAHLFVVNKADKDGAQEVAAQLESMATVKRGAWIQPVCLTVATTGQGVDALADELERHRTHEVSGPGLVERRSARAMEHLMAMAREETLSRLSQVRSSQQGRRLAELVARGELNPLAAVQELLGQALPAGTPETEIDGGNR